MIRNDYRRALILLRSAVKGMSGHVRLERRTLTGSMRFSLAGAGTNDALRAVLLRKGKGGWTAVPMGAMHVDNRGQAGLTWTFDPRNIDGYTLEDYPVVAVLRFDKNGMAEPAMSGYVNGSSDVDWTQAMNAAKRLYRQNEAIPVWEEIGSVAQTKTEPTTEAAQDESVVQDESAVQEPEEAVLPESLDEASPAETESAQIEEAVEPESEQPSEPIPAETSEMETGETENPTPESSETEAAYVKLALDITIAWPEPVEPLRALFLQLPAYTPFEADGYVFVRAPLPGSGRAHSLVGIRVEDERPTSVCYGIPGIFALEPPAGLEGYSWRGEGGHGWWITFIDAETGEEIGE